MKIVSFPRIKLKHFFSHAPLFVIASLFASLLISCSDEDNQLPVIENLSPSDESLIKDVSVVKLKADVKDVDGSVTKVEFIINNQIVGEALAVPYEFDWTPSASGHYSFKVKAFDNTGNFKTSEEAIFTAVGFSCTGSSSCPTFSPKTSSHVVMAFYPSWKAGVLPVNSIPWTKITHIIYSFALPISNGELNTADINGTIDNLVEKAHANGVKVYFSVGGGVGSDPFIPLSANERMRALFADRVKCYIQDNCLDGVDIDWEHWNGADKVINAESEGLVNLVSDLRKTLDQKIEISIDVAATNWGGKHIFDEVANHVTYVNAMLYDLRGPWSEAGPHSAYNEVITDGTTNYSINSWGLAYWTGYRKWPAAKTVVGIPFYGRDFDINKGDGVDYRTLATRVQNAGANINADRIGNAYYDGPVTVSKKAAYARDNNYAGVMFWELTGDTNDNTTSLLEAIRKELQ